MNRDEIASILFDESKKVTAYPDKLIPIPQLVDTSAFFPVGKGVFPDKENKHTLDILILGQDFGTVEQYNNIFSKKIKDEDTPTFKEIRQMLITAEIPIESCFFSNSLLGLRKSKNNIGISPGYRNEYFLIENDSFLLFQIEKIKPKFIITLGSVAPQIISRISIKHEWKDFKFKVNQNIHESIHEIQFTNKDIIPCIPILHPSMGFRYAISKRVFNDAQGRNAEIQALMFMFKTYCGKGV